MKGGNKMKTMTMYNKFKALPDNLKDQVNDYIEFLFEKKQKKIEDKKVINNRSLFGILNKYKDLSLLKMEKSAWKDTVKEKHDNN